MLRAFLVGRTVRITLAHCQLWPSLEHGNRINRKLPLLPMKLKLEAIRQQLLQHLLHLLQARLALYVRHAAYVVPIGPKPRRPVHDLPHVNPISSRKNLAHALIPYGNVPPVGTEPIAFVFRIAWFDRCDLKPRMRISGHHLARLRPCTRPLRRMRHPEPNHHADEHHNQSHPHNQLHPSPPFRSVSSLGAPHLASEMWDRLNSRSAAQPEPPPAHPPGPSPTPASTQAVPESP